MSQTKKELRKSLKKWRSELKQITKTLELEKEDTFLFEALTNKKKELEGVVQVIEKQLGASYEEGQENSIYG